MCSAASSQVQRSSPCICVKCVAGKGVLSCVIDRVRYCRTFTLSTLYSDIQILQNCLTTPEMEFLISIVVEVSGHKLESSQTRVFYHNFSVLQNDIHEYTRVFLFFLYF
jgi:hypothetical protein